MMTWIALAVSIVCMIINFVLAIRALQHKGVGTAYRIATFTLMALIVFNAVNGGGVRGYFAVPVSAVIPVLFVIALAKQDKLDREQ